MKDSIPVEYREILNQIIGVLKARFEPDKIILFGSLARGELEELGDVDLLVIANTEMTFRQRARAAAEIAEPFDEDLDIFVYTPSEYAEMNHEWHPFIESIKRNHVVLYEKGKESEI